MAKSGKETNLQETEPVTRTEAQPVELAPPVPTDLVPESKPASDLITDDRVIEYYEEAMECIKEDRGEAHERYLDFADMAINDGDPSSATKEALVNLLKLKNESVNQMIKILDLWTRMKMKDRTTGSQVYAYQQNNKYDMAKANPNVKKLIKMAQEMESK